MEAAFEDLSELLAQNSLVTFRFYAQHANVPVGQAKKLLQEYADANKGQVHVVFLVGGVLKGDASGYTFLFGLRTPYPVCMRRSHATRWLPR